MKVQQRESAVASLGVSALIAIAVFFCAIRVGRQSIALILALIALAHLVIATHLFKFEGWLYYPSAAFAQYLAVVFMVKCHGITVLIRDLSIVLTAGMFINLAGWGLWWSGYGPGVYNGVSIIFYLALAVRLLIRKRGDGRLARISPVCSWVSWVSTPISINVFSTTKADP